MAAAAQLESCHQVAKMVFSLVITRPERGNVLSGVSQNLDEDIYGPYGDLFRRMSQSHHKASDPLIFRQLGYWPYPSGNRRGTISLPYVQLRVDVHVRPLQDIEDFTIDLEVYQRESWQNQLCAQRILKLLRYCIDNSDPDVEMCPRAIVKVTGEVYDLARAFIAAKESDVETFLDGIERRLDREGPFAALPPQDTWPDCECPFDVLLREILTLNPTDYLASRADPPPSLAFLAREALVRAIPDRKVAKTYFKDNCVVHGVRSDMLRDLVKTSCYGRPRQRPIPRVRTWANFRRDVTVTPMSLQHLEGRMPNRPLMVLFQAEISEIMRLRTLTWIRDAHASRPFPHCSNPVDMQEFLHSNNTRDPILPGRLCARRHDDHVYVLAMVIMRLVRRNT